MKINFPQVASQFEEYVREASTGTPLPEKVKTYLNETYPANSETALRLEEEYLADGPLTALLPDTDVTEIIINGTNGIVYEKHGTLHSWPERFLTPISFRNFFVHLCTECHLVTSIEQPFADGRWRAFRVHIADLPCGDNGPIITLRRTNIRPWTLELLAQAGWCTSQQKVVLETIFQEDCNGLIVGTTGSGKTSVLNAYLQSLAPTRRLVIIEDSLELLSPNVFCSRLVTRRDAQGILPEVTQQNLVQQSLRMRPDSLIMGEVRGGEAKDLLMSWATGHTQSWSTLHADSARQALLRLEMLIQLGAPQWSLQAVRNLILISLKYVVTVERSSQGVRKLKDVYRLVSLEEEGILIEPLEY